MMVSFRVGDTIAVFIKSKGATRTRRQAFEGIVIGFSGKGETRTFTIRRIGPAGVGMERIWPINSPSIEKIEVRQKGKVKRSKLYWLRRKR
jgi:large subunit ribosomal protein L19